MVVRLSSHHPYYLPRCPSRVVPTPPLPRHPGLDGVEIGIFPGPLPTKHRYNQLSAHPIYLTETGRGISTPFICKVAARTDLVTS